MSTSRYDALSREFTRRTALFATSAVAGSGLLAACGGGGSTAESTPADTTVSAADVPVGGGFIDKKSSVVVTQPQKGTYKAFSAVCTHQGCLVGSVTSTSIVCTCHGSHFDPNTGEVTAGPAQKALPAKKVAVQGSSLHVTG